VSGVAGGELNRCQGLSNRFGRQQKRVTTPLTQLAAAALLAIGCAIAAFPLFALSRRARAGLLLIPCVAIAAAPCLISLEYVLVRFLAAVVCVVLLVKLYDLHISAVHDDRPGFGASPAWLANWFSVVHRRLRAEPCPTRRDDVYQLVVGAAGCAAGSFLLGAAFHVDWSDAPFLAEHAAKVLALFAALVPGAQALSAGWRLLGGRGRDYMDNPFVARTPADFWRRYNRVAHQFFYENIFKQSGGVRSPGRALLATFAASAVVHEYLFSAAIGRVQGYQTAFFLLHGGAVAATWRIRPAGPAALLWIAGTVAFNLGSSMLFFASVNELLPFYQPARSS
jgi:hypothetical protein